jgi:hypothetical protein
LHYYFIERHFFGFATATQAHGDAPWWLYIPALLGGGLPWIGYLPVTIRELIATSEPVPSPVPCPRLSWACWRGWINRLMPTASVGMAPGTNKDKPQGRPEVLLWCWLLGCTILLSLAQSKLVTYLWPVFPAVAILASIGWARLLDGTLGAAAKQSLRKNFMMSSCVGPFVLPIAVFVLQKAFDIQFGLQVWAAAIIVGLGTLVPLWFLFQEKWQAMLAASALTTAAQYFMVLSLLVPVVADLYSEKQLAEYFNAPPAGSPCLPAKMYFVEQRIGSFVFYLDPALRASIVENQLQEIPRPKNPLERKTAFRPGDVVVLPGNRVRRAEEYLEIKNLSFHKVGIFRLVIGER